MAYECSQEPHPGVEFYGVGGGCAECGYRPEPSRWQYTAPEFDARTVSFSTTQLNVPLLEILTHLCATCRVDLSDCTCHDEGKGTQ